MGSVGRIRLPRQRRGGQREMKESEFPRRLGYRFRCGVVIPESQRYPKGVCPGLQQRAVGDHHPFHPGGVSGKLDTELRTDASRFAGGDDDTFRCHGRYGRDYRPVFRARRFST